MKKEEKEKTEDFCPFYGGTCPKRNGCVFWDNGCLIKNLAKEVVRVSKMLNGKLGNGNGKMSGSGIFSMVAKLL